MAIVGSWTTWERAERERVFISLQSSFSRFSRHQRPVSQLLFLITASIETAEGERTENTRKTTSLYVPTDSANVVIALLLFFLKKLINNNITTSWSAVHSFHDVRTRWSISSVSGEGRERAKSKYPWSGRWRQQRESSSREAPAKKERAPASTVGNSTSKGETVGIRGEWD